MILNEKWQKFGFCEIILNIANARHHELNLLTRYRMRGAVGQWGWWFKMLQQRINARFNIRFNRVSTTQLSYWRRGGMNGILAQRDISTYCAMLSIIAAL